MNDPFLIIADRAPEGTTPYPFTDAAKNISGFRLDTRPNIDTAVSYALRQLDKGLGAVRVIKYQGDVTTVVFTAEAAW